MPSSERPARYRLQRYNFQADTVQHENRYFALDRNNISERAQSVFEEMSKDLLYFRAPWFFCWMIGSSCSPYVFCIHALLIHIGFLPDGDVSICWESDAQFFTSIALKSA